MNNRRVFSRAYKLSILKELDACSENGEIEMILRRENLHYSNITLWRRQSTEGILKKLGPKKRGRKAKHKNPLVHEIVKLEKKIARIKEKIKQTEIIIDAQKKLSVIVNRYTTPKKRRLFLMEQARILSKTIGPGTACSMLGINRASFYRFCRKQNRSEIKKDDPDQNDPG